MRLIFVSSGLAARYGGAPISEASLAAALKPELDLRLLVPADRLERAFVRQFGLEDVLVPFRRTDLRKLRPHFSPGAVLHVNGHWRWENYFLARMALSSGVPWILHPRGMCLVGHRKVPLKRLFNRCLGNFVVRGASRLILLSRFERNHLDPYGIDESRIEVIPNGITPPPPGRPASPEGFLYYGRVESRKNLLFLLDAYGIYRQAGGTAPLACMGPVERGYDALLESRARALGVGGGFQIEAPLYGPEKWHRIRSALAVVYPTSEEAFGRVPFEAVAAGVAPLVPDRSGGAEYLGRFLSAGIYREGSPEDLARCLAEVESARRAGRDIGVEEARRWVERELDWERLAARFLEIYDRVLGAEPRRFEVAR